MNCLDGEVVPVGQPRQASIIRKTIQCSLDKFLIPAMDGRTFFLDVAMDPSHLFEVLLVALSIVDDELPSSILLVLALGGTSLANTAFLSRK